ncbi:MAG: glycosyltransferase [Bacteroidales bacterium]|nr:glycosyltransferase [Bacteroidales bacterium]MBR4498052.1 glycosyltransferase [Bacteroidales bacterium]
MQKKKVLFFVNSMGVGGAERVTITIAKMLNEDIFDISFVLVGRRVEKIKDFIPDKYACIHLKVFNIWCFSIFKMLRVIEIMNPDIVFSSQTFINWRVLLAVWIKNRNIKTIIRSNCKAKEIKGLYKRMVSYTYPKATYLVMQTENMTEDFIDTFKLCRSQVITMHNPLDTDIIESKLNGVGNPYCGKNKKIVWIGHYSYVKGVDILIKAFTKVINHKENLELYLVGGYDESDFYYRFVIDWLKKYHLEQKVHILGYQDNPYKWIKYADVFVLSSRSEASPNVLFESLYLGTPVVVTQCTENINFIVIQGKNGYIVPVDNADELSQALLNVLQKGVKDVKLTYDLSTKEEWCRIFK